MTRSSATATATAPANVKSVGPATGQTTGPATAPATGQTTITVLSVRQPFADHLVHPHPKLGPKWIENRSWITRYRGPLYIHASRWDAKPTGEQAGAADQSIDDLWRTAGDGLTGAIIGCVDLVACGDQRGIEECYCVLNKQSRRKLTDRQQALVPFLPDPQTRAGSKAWDWWCGDAGLIVANPRALRDPILTGGKLGLWRFTTPADRLIFRD